MTILALLLLLFLFLFVSMKEIAGLIHSRHLQMQPSLHMRKPTKLKQFGLRLFLVPQNSDQLDPIRRKLAAAGMMMRAEMYVLMRRMLLFSGLCLLGICLIDYRLSHHPISLMFAIGLMIVVVLALMDDWLLHVVKQRRQKMMMQDIYRICQHLLYYSESRMNLHGKLMRCVTVTGPSRRAFTWMLNEWYEDPYKAIESFKQRLGTNEAYDFAELLHTLRLDEHEAYYELLRTRVRDYKEKMDLVKDSVKEVRSYVLFVMAGIPILNTFRVFIYPWVEEGEKLFQLIQS